MKSLSLEECSSITKTALGYTGTIDAESVSAMIDALVKLNSNSSDTYIVRLTGAIRVFIELYPKANSLLATHAYLSMMLTCIHCYCYSHLGSASKITSTAKTLHWVLIMTHLVHLNFQAYMDMYSTELEIAYGELTESDTRNFHTFVLDSYNSYVEAETDALIEQYEFDKRFN